MAAKTKPQAKLAKGVDAELAEYLKQAEEALIGAVKLFTEHPTLERRVGYFSRLVRAQETITTLYREELVRIRGSIRPRQRK
jgi:hypothetical protein